MITSLKGSVQRHCILSFSCTCYSAVNLFVSIIIVNCRYDACIHCIVTCYFIFVCQVIWEFHDNDGLWQSLPCESSFIIESSYFEQKTNFGMGNSEEDMYHYNLGNMSRVLVKSKHSQRLKRTPFIWDKPESKLNPESTACVLL